MENFLKNIVEVSIDYVDENGVTHFDGYTTDEDESGRTLAYGINGEVYYCHPNCRYNPLVVDAVRDYKAAQ